jgi:hypothetical protein
MAKAINWPPQFRDEIIAEDTEQLHCAFRLGDLYYENRYWVPDEVVDIRANHRRIRQAKVVGDLRQCAIGDLAEADLLAQKRSLQSKAALIQFLTETYSQPVDEQTLITIVTYQNLPLVPEEMDVQDDSHMED